MNGIGIATRGYVPLTPTHVALRGYVATAASQELTAASVLQILAFGAPVVTQDPTQRLYATSVLQRVAGGPHVVTGGNTAARWLWVKVWQPLWTWIDGAVGGNDES